MALLGGFLLSQALGTAHQLAGPVISQSLSEFRDAAGWNDLARSRAVLYRQNFGSTQRSLSDNFTPFRFNLDQALQSFNRWTWPQADGNEPARERRWRKLAEQLRFNGIDASLTSFGAGDVTRAVGGTTDAHDWYRLIEMSSRAAPLEQTIHDYYRSLGQPEALRTVSQAELNYNLQRAEYRRKQDRDRILSPWYPWTIQDAQRLHWLGVANNADFNRLANAAGVHQAEDGEYLTALMRRMPDAGTLWQWASRQLWDEVITDRFQLDEGFDDSPVAQFYIKAQGIRPAEPLPGQPPGEADFAKLAYRNSRRIPTFAEAIQLQRRLRPDGAGHGDSVVEGSTEWLRDSTEAVLKAEGYSQRVREQMHGLVQEPLSLRYVSMILTNVLEHPAVARVVHQFFGQREVDMVEEACRDAGLSDGHTAVVAAAIKQEAHDKAFAEMIGHKKQIRDEERKQAIDRYELGTMEIQDAMTDMEDRQYTHPMALKQLQLVDARILMEIAAEKVKALRESFMTGHLSAQVVTQQLTAAGIRDDRRQQYMELWQWERNANQRMLTTAEILDALKKGILPANQAQQRLVNLGWAGADAMIEIAQVQHDLQVTQQKQQAVQASRTAQQQAAQQRQAQAAQHKQSIAQAIAAKAKAKLTHEQTTAVHHKLMDQSKYYAEVHMANSAYHAADKVGDEQKKQAELAKQIADYQHYLIEQLDLASIDPTVQREIGPLETAQAPGPDTSTPVSGAPGKPPAPSGGPGGTTGGTAQQGGSGPTVP